jgi:hypothetical protein
VIDGCGGREAAWAPEETKQLLPVQNSLIAPGVVVPDGVASAETNPLRNRAVLLLSLGKLLLGLEGLVALWESVSALIRRHCCPRETSPTSVRAGSIRRGGEGDCRASNGTRGNASRERLEYGGTNRHFDGVVAIRDGVVMLRFDERRRGVGIISSVWAGKMRSRARLWEWPNNVSEWGRCGGVARLQTVWRLCDNTVKRLRYSA